MLDCERQKIMLVDDNKANLTIGKSILENNYDVFALPSADKMFNFLKHVTPDIILLDVEMPGTNGYDAITILKGKRQYADIPVIFVTSKSSEWDQYNGLALGAIDYVTKPFSATLLLKRIENHLLSQRQKTVLQDFNENLLKMVRDKTQQVYGLQNAIIGTVADIVECRDDSTGWHISRTQKYMQTLVEQLIADDINADELLSWNMDIVLPSSQLHDLGKISISDAILNKPGKLTPVEFDIMKTHALRGVEVLEKMEKYGDFIEFLQYAKVFAATHHEKWDGSGYPYALKGLEIPFAGRIMAIADVYDALTTDRPYKKAFTTEASAHIIYEGAGSHFDPAIVRSFSKIEGKFSEIAENNRGLQACAADAHSRGLQDCAADDHSRGLQDCAADDHSRGLQDCAIG